MDHTNRFFCSEGPLSPLARRTIEIGLVGSLLSVLRSEYGEEQAWAVLRKVVDAEAMAAAAVYRSGHAELTLKDLLKIWQELGGDGRLDIRLDELTANSLRFHVARCSYAEMYRSRGLEELGIAFSCERDEPFATALIPQVRMRRSKSILEGSACCEFEYWLEN